MSIQIINQNRAHEPGFDTLSNLPWGNRNLLTDNLQVGIAGAPLKQLLSAATAWNPPALASGAVTATTLTVPGAAVGNPVIVGLYPAVPVGVFAVANVTAADTVTVTLVNLSSVAYDHPAGSVRAAVFQF
jgi:hypothetical protein